MMEILKNCKPKEIKTSNQTERKEKDGHKNGTVSRQDKPVELNTAGDGGLNTAGEGGLKVSANRVL